MTGRKNRILIIGASGFIGSSLALKLLRKGAKISAVIGCSGLKYLRPIQKELKIYTYRKIKDKLGRLGKFEYIYNLSGHTNLKNSFKMPLSYEGNKPITTINLIENARTEKFINISTGSVYDYSDNPLSEETPLNPQSPYAISQLTADYYTQVLCRYRKIPYLILRLFNPYGPPNLTRGFIANVISKLLGNKEVVLYNPKRRFDFTFIDDIIEAMLFCSRKKNEIFNIGSGRPVSLLEAYNRIRSFIGKVSLRPHIERCAQEREEIISDNAKLRRYGFRFRYDIDRGLKITVNRFLEEIR